MRQEVENNRARMERRLLDIGRMPKGCRQTQPVIGNGYIGKISTKSFFQILGGKRDRPGKADGERLVIVGDAHFDRLRSRRRFQNQPPEIRMHGGAGDDDNRRRLIG